jgi:Domain of unknown function (DUF4307)
VTSATPPQATGARASRSRPAGRYGDEPRPGRRRAGIAAIAVGASLAVGFVLWAGLHLATPDVRTALLAYEEITETSVTVRFEVVKDAGATVVCRVRARNLDNVSVGGQDVLVGPPEHGARSVVEVVLPTTERPINGELTGCRLQ